MSYSTSGGGTLTLPSPTHVHHVDVSSAVRSLRRSLSRSPSKFRLVTTKSPTSTPHSPLSPSPLSPQHRSSSHPNFFASNPPHTPSPLAVPFPPSQKLALRSASRAKSATPRASSRTRTSPKSPMKRALSQTSSNGNATPSSGNGTTVGQENSCSTSPTERKSLERAPKMPLENTAPINHALSRLGGEGGNDYHAPSTTSSPLKRSDAIMNLDQASLGSPVAKRRSLHGSASFGHDFNVFDHGPTSSHFEIHDDLNHEYELSTNSNTSENSLTSALTSMPRRSSSLRKSTLQQRHGERTSWGKRHAAAVLAAQQMVQNNPPEVSTPVISRNRPRLSLDQFIAPPVRDSPFTSHSNLPNASMHMMHQPTHPPVHQPHPLSRTMTTSSSSSSIPDESPTHAPTHFPQHQPRKTDFSKSLPAGSLRPFALEPTNDGEPSFATPQNYKNVKPLPAAFASTGLISKVNRNPEQPQLTRGISKEQVPDTPCKKQTNIFATYPAPVAGSAIAKARHIRHSFGTPSTPFNPHGTQSTPGTFGNGIGVFGGVFGGLTRRGSFLSIDGDDHSESPDAKKDSQASNDSEFPPTPTKQILTQHPNDGSPSNYRSFPASVSAVGYGLTKRLPRTSSKLNLFTSPDQARDDSNSSTDENDSPTAAAHFRVMQTSESVPSFSRSRTLRALNQQISAPTIPKSLTTSFISPYKPNFAKISHVAPASPLDRIDFIEKLAPRTPQDGMLPPDPSGLSISHPRDGQAAKTGAPTSMPPPATPTTGREYFPMMGDRRLSTTPIGSFAPIEVDDSLASRFDLVEMIGGGEFSRVFKVTQNAQLAKSVCHFEFGTPSSGLQRRSLPALMPERVYAVKKSRQPFQGIRDRQRKLQEVQALKALGQSDHVVHLIDSWEAKNHLYIQTEYCEEGSLDMFLNEVGRKGRIDDFRIWKIMLELSLGLKHIHESGYIHLDLKPANVLITFEGVLKIADFGMATTWPAPKGIEGEGDREYIAPEILEGRYDKPADVFALGIIMFEIAGNVQLPDNGPTWQRLRSGDLSDVPSLTWSSDSGMARDANGIPIDESEEIIMDNFASDDEMTTDFGSPTMNTRKRNLHKSHSHDPGNLFGSMRRGELHRAPAFMRDMYDQHALDGLVNLMLTPNPDDRPTIQHVRKHEGIKWVENRRRAGATVFEGNWGPADDILADDAEMMDV